MDILKEVLSRYDKYEFETFQDEDVLEAIGKDTLHERDFAALLSPAAQGRLEEMARQARRRTAQYFGNSVRCLHPYILPLLRKSMRVLWI